LASDTFPDKSWLPNRSHLGGSGFDLVFDLALDREGNAYVIGYTTSRDFPVLGGFQSTLAGGYDAFVEEESCLTVEI